MDIHNWHVYVNLPASQKLINYFCQLIIFISIILFLYIYVNMLFTSFIAAITNFIAFCRLWLRISYGEREESYHLLKRIFINRPVKQPGLPGLEGRLGTSCVFYICGHFHNSVNKHTLANKITFPFFCRWPLRNTR